MQDALQNSNCYLDRAPLSSGGTVVVDNMPMLREGFFVDEKLLIQHMAYSCGVPYRGVISRWSKDFGDGRLRDGSILP